MTSTVASHVTYAGMGFGPRAQMRMGDGSGRQSSWTYDANYRLTNTKATNLHNLTFGYDLGNRLTGITDGITAANSQALGYDGLDRLTSVTSTGVGNQGWTFDLNGNRESHAWGGLTDDYLPDLNSNRIGSLTGSRAKTYTHDLRGNTATEAGWRGSYTYGYDPFNRQTSVTKNGVTTTYSYNALNQRTRKAGPGGNFNYVHAPDGSLLGETSAGGTSLTTQYIWLEGKPIALIRSNTLYFIRHDQLGRPDVVSNTAGSIVWKARNAAYDRTVTTDTIGGLNLGFPGQYYDSESGNWYNWNRYYDSTGGRYTQSDPIGLAGGLNTYSYVGGNPILAIDPQGLISLFAGGGANGVLGSNASAKGLGTVCTLGGGCASYSYRATEAREYSLACEEGAPPPHLGVGGSLSGSIGIYRGGHSTFAGIANTVDIGFPPFDVGISLFFNPANGTLMGGSLNYGLGGGAAAYTTTTTVNQWNR